MSYVDGYHSKDDSRVYVVERVNGERVYKDYPANYSFYHDDPKGKFRTILDTPVSKITLRSWKEFQKETRMFPREKVWESDINPVFKCLEEYYHGIESPKLNVAFFDIETDFHQEMGFAPADDPFNAVTAISIYLSWTKQCITLVKPPKTLSLETAEDVAKRFDNCYVFEKESELLDTFLTLIDDADILSGWNSEGYDIPYTVNRVKRILSNDDTRRFCLWGKMPSKRTFERYGAEHNTYDLGGRVHLDYMQLYRKYTYHEMHSYSLDAIAEYELDSHKTKYDGTLDQLYNNDFERFIEYNRQDTNLLAELDNKLGFIGLANEIAHDNTVLLQTTSGAVAVTEQAIINESHARGMIVPNRKRSSNEDSVGDDDPLFNEDQAAGAYVVNPKVGMHRYIGVIDINSLYPSTIRALNMGPDTVIGQLRATATNAMLNEKMKDQHKKKGMSFADAWEGQFGSLEYQAVMRQELGTPITIDWENGDPTEHSAKEVWELIFNNKKSICISANGTIFSYEKKGIIPGLLERWYSERKIMQAKKKEATEQAEIEMWDRKQNVKKVNLNSLYGAILNPGCRFFDHRIGQSTTLTGRCIAKHMDAYVNECITGEYNHTGAAIIYGDTDSGIFSAWPIIEEAVKSGEQEWNKEIAVELYDTIAERVNESFPAFMEQAFRCTREHGAIIKGGRELLGISGLFIKKKRYAILMYEYEGARFDLFDEATAKKKGIHFGHGKVKAMGLDLKRADTPKIVQDFLSDILLDVLTMKNKDFVVEKIRVFKKMFSDMAAWEKGTPKRVNNLTSYTGKHENGTKGMIPGHVMGAINWNKLRMLNGDQHSPKIVDGMKTIACKIRNNPSGMTTVGYPIDIAHLPQWFTELPFDVDEMEKAIVDKKVTNLLGVMNWDIEAATEFKSTFNSLFNFG